MQFVAYYRVSTDKQGRSGLGLEAQQEAVRQFVGAAKVIASYKEIETGRNNDRPKLSEAIAHAKRAKARLVIAKLDRLSRNVHFTSGLIETGVDFVACDNPNANRLTIHILAAVAEDEAERISSRTKAALAALKARGVKLGAQRPECAKNLSPEAAARGRIEGARKMKQLALGTVLEAEKCR
jgi:DNA invertase Pin-like site-specific DNA recombinase